MDWLQLGIQATIIIVSLVLAWAKFDKRMALSHQRQGTMEDRITLIETNHLVHIEKDLKGMNESMHCMKESIIRIEESLKK